MKNTLIAHFLLLALLTPGCQSVSEKAASIQPLAENTPVPPYQDLLSRARNQSSVATESFFINNWAELEDAAKGLEQTSRLMSKSADMPENKKRVNLGGIIRSKSGSSKTKRSMQNKKRSRSKYTTSKNNLKNSRT